MVEMMKKAEVAATFRVTTRTVENYVRQGLLPQPTRIGRRPLWPAAVIRAMVTPPQGAAA